MTTQGKTLTEEERLFALEYNKSILFNSKTNKDTFTLIANSIKGKEICEKQRKDFITSRSFSIGKIYDPTFSERDTENFLNCYISVSVKGAKECNSSLNDIVQCLEHNMTRDFPVVCVSAMDKYKSC